MLRAFYARVDPSKLKNVDMILAQYGDDRERMCAAIEGKYPGEKLERPSSRGSEQRGSEDQDHRGHGHHRHKHRHSGSSRRHKGKKMKRTPSKHVMELRKKRRKKSRMQNGSRKRRGNRRPTSVQVGNVESLTEDGATPGVNPGGKTWAQSRRPSLGSNGPSLYKVPKVPTRPRSSSYRKHDRRQTKPRGVGRRHSIVGSGL